MGQRQTAPHGKQMFKISEFSRLAQVPAKTLRYYAEIGLFAPAKTDPFTSYRYYSAEQLIDLNRILALKALGLSLEQIIALVKEGVSIEQVKQMLQRKHAETLETLQNEQKRLGYLEMRLQYLETAGKFPDYDVIVKQVEPITVISLREFVPDLSVIGEAVGRSFGRLYEFLGRHGEPPAGVAMGLYHDEEMPEQQIDVEIAIPIAHPIPAPDDFKVYTLPASEMICTIHKGSFDQIGQAYSSLLWWLQTNNHTTLTPSREVYLQYGSTPADNLTELQYPVKPR